MAKSPSKHHFPWLGLFLLTGSTFSFPNPTFCFNTTLNLPMTITKVPTLLDLVLFSLKSAIDEATKFSTILSITTTSQAFIKHPKGSLQDCMELHEISISALRKSISKIKSSKLSDAVALLSGALTAKSTCLEALDHSKQTLMNSITDTYKHVSNALSMLVHHHSPPMAIFDMPPWLDPVGRSIILQDHKGRKPKYRNMIVVAKDGSGKFSMIQDAVNYVPSNCKHRSVIYVKKGVYKENVEIPRNKPNIVLMGQGRNVTIIVGSRSTADGWSTFRSATVGVSAEGFLALGITFKNISGRKKGQAVALRINADSSAVYRCTILGFQDTLYVHSFRQFYRECNIYGTIDYIFGNAAVIFQHCHIVSRMPTLGQATVITAQSREDSTWATGISIQNCSIRPTKKLWANRANVKSYLGRPWREYARTVFIKSYIGKFIDPLGWTTMVGNYGLKTLYYGEYGNRGPGSGTIGRVTWPGYHVMGYEEANHFTVSKFINGDDHWLDSTPFPYDKRI